MYRFSKTGCNSVSWAPAFPQDDNQTSNGLSAKRIASGGCDNVVKIWREENGKWELEQALTGHNDWVRDVAWSQNIIHSKTNIASCSQVFILKKILLLSWMRRCNSSTKLKHQTKIIEYVLVKGLFNHSCPNFITDRLEYID